MRESITTSDALRSCFWYASLSPASSLGLWGCIATGEACLAYCLVLLGDGDKTMADFTDAVAAQGSIEFGSANVGFEIAAAARRYPAER